MASNSKPTYKPAHAQTALRGFLSLRPTSHAILDIQTPPVLEVLFCFDGGCLSVRLRRQFFRGNVSEPGRARRRGRQPSSDAKSITGSFSSAKPITYTGSSSYARACVSTSTGGTSTAAFASTFTVAASGGTHGHERFGQVHSGPGQDGKRQPQ